MKTGCDEKDRHPEDDKCVEKLILLATSIALELAKDKSRHEIDELRTFLYQICATLSTICSLMK